MPKLGDGSFIEIVTDLMLFDDGKSHFIGELVDRIGKLRIGLVPERIELGGSRAVLFGMWRVVIPFKGRSPMTRRHQDDDFLGERLKSCFLGGVLTKLLGDFGELNIVE